MAVHIRRHRTEQLGYFSVLKRQHFVSMRKTSRDIMRTAISESPDSRYCRQLYRAALFEIEESTLQATIAETDQAVVLLSPTILHPTHPNTYHHTVPLL